MFISSTASLTFLVLFILGLIAFAAIKLKPEPRSDIKAVSSLLTDEDKVSLLKVLKGEKESIKEFSQEQIIWWTNLNKAKDDYYDGVRVTRLNFLRALSKADTKNLAKLIEKEGHEINDPTLLEEKNRWIESLDALIPKVEETS